MLLVRPDRGCFWHHSLDLLEFGTPCKSEDATVAKNRVCDIATVLTFRVLVVQLFCLMAIQAHNISPLLTKSGKPLPCATCCKFVL